MDERCHLSCVAWHPAQTISCGGLRIFRWVRAPAAVLPSFPDCLRLGGLANEARAGIDRLLGRVQLRRRPGTDVGFLPDRTPRA